ncbi:MAG: hypothetical protein GC161_04760 [Planctomycetaceae bacterium]|nr:hypothetical protein [Planctomycetaceae bacterium]
MKQVLLLALLGSLLVAVWWVATAEAPERDDVVERSPTRAADEFTGAVSLAGVGAVEPRSDEPTRTMAAVSGAAVDDSATRAADGLAEMDDEPSFATHVVALAVDHRGRPMADRELQLAWHRAEETHAVPEPVARARADASGAVRFGVTPGSLANANVSLYVRDSETGARTWIAEAVLPSEGELDLGTLVLALPRELYPEVLVSGRVTDHDFAPVPGVKGRAFAHRSLDDATGGDRRNEPSQSEVVIATTGHFAVYGPPTTEYLSLGFSSSGYSNAHLSEVQPRTHGLEVFLSRELRLRGRLIVPEHGPSVTSYCVWLFSDAGNGGGVTPTRDGEFHARGPSGSVELRVTQPALGLVLFHEVFAVTPETGGDLGTIDLRPVAKPLDVQLVDGTGSALAKVTVQMEVKGAANATGHARASLRTDYTGRLFVCVPAHALEAQLTVLGRAPVVVDLVTPPERVELR